jgi:predicted transcriptional regulator
MISRKSRIVKLNPDNYYVVNKVTGELLDVSNLQLTKTKTENKMRVSSEKYVTLDTEAVSNMIKSQGVDLNRLKLDLGFLFLISPYISFLTNALVDENNKPLTTKTLALELGIAEKTINNSINPLIKYGLLYKGSIKNSTYKNNKVYWVNPTIIRKGKDFLPELLNIFNDLAYDQSKHNYKKDSLFKHRGE